MSRNEEATLWLKIKQVGGEILDRFVITLGDVINVMKSVASAAWSTIEAYQEQEEAVKKLNQAMENQGVYTGALEQRYIDLATALQKVTTFGDEQIINAQAILQAHIGSREVTEDLVRATLDLATAKKMDLASAAELVGKSISSENNLLSRQGIELNESIAKHDKMAAVIQAVSSKYDGYAAASAKGLGATKQAQNAFSDLLEAIGEKLAPAVSNWSKMFGSMFSTMAEWVSGNQNVKKSTSDLLLEMTALQYKIKDIQKRGAGGEKRMGNYGIMVSISDTEIPKLEAQLAQVKSMYDNQRAQEENALFAHLQKKKEITAQKFIENKESEMELAIAKQEAEMEFIMASEEQKEAAKLDVQIRAAEAKLAQATTANERIAVMQEIYRLNEEKKEKLHQQKLLKDRDDFLNLAASMQNSGNQTMATIGKAAALTQIAIKTPEAVGSAFAWGSSWGGPPGGFAMAAIAGAAMADQAARVAGIQLAEGGIVMPRPGGVQATIAEAGQAEAVIPLDRAGEFGLGGGSGGVTINVYGGLLGDPSTAREFAVAVDKQLLELRRNNESVAFDSGVV